MRKRLLLHYPVLNLGGAEMSSLRMMKALADRGWDITLVVTTGRGSLEALVDERVQIVRLRPQAVDFVWRGGFWLLRKPRDWIPFGRYIVTRAIGVARMLPFIFRRYDAAAMLLVSKSTVFLRYLVRARKKLQWVRNDLGGADPTGRLRAELARAEQSIDWFVCVSEVTRRSLIAAIPHAAPKAVVIYNLLDAKSMTALARVGQDPFPPRHGKEIRILTVCRLVDRPKGLYRMVRVCRRLHEAGHTFRWFIIGDGQDRENLEHAIQQAGMTKRMIVMGQMENPFPAFANADIVAMLSNYEGLSGVVNEARVLERPVIATRVSGVDEQLIDNVNALVVENAEDAIFIGMEKLLADSILRDRLARGGYPNYLLDDEGKVSLLESLFGWPGPSV